MNDQSKTSNQATSKGSSGLGSSRESESGTQPSTSLDGPMTDLFGMALAPAKTGPSPEKAKAQGTTETYGRYLPASSQSASLSSSLANRLKQLLGKGGSTVYEQTWKRKRTPSGVTYWAHIASGVITNDSGCTGWPTASKLDFKDTPGMAEVGTNPDGSERSRLDQLSRVAHLTSGSRGCGGRAETGSGGESPPDGWATPRAGKTSDENPETWQKRKDKGDVSTMPLTTQAKMAAFPTPREGSEEGYKTRAARKDHECALSYLESNVDYNFSLPDMTDWRLNPRFSLWLMMGRDHAEVWYQAWLKARDALWIRKKDKSKTKKRLKKLTGSSSRSPRTTPDVQEP